MPIVLKSGSLRLLEILGPVQVRSRIVLLLIILLMALCKHFASILEVVNIYRNLFGNIQKKILLGNLAIYANKT